MATKDKLRFKELVSRVTGSSTPVFGVSWQPPVSERDKVRAIVTFLEDRRVLFNPYHLEEEQQVTHSVIEIRHEITRVLSELPEDAKAESSLRAMRAVCRKFLDDESHPEIAYFHHGRMAAGFLVALGELRATFGTHLALLAVQYGIDLEPDLASIVPAQDQHGDGD